MATNSVRGAAALILAWLLLSLALSSEPGVADSVVVNKSRHELLLLQRGRVLRSYRVALGHQPVGPKTMQGDGRTPEGRYQIDSRNPQSRFHLALHISYPNATDTKRAGHLQVDAGGDIMIHGLPRWAGILGRTHRALDWTDGCIAVSNSEIEEIWRLVPVGTAVQINP
jgi:murein L,D-transpeptidase YafK